MGLGKKAWGWGKQNPVLLGQGWEAARSSAVLFVTCFVLTTLGALSVIPQLLVVQKANTQLPLFKSHTLGKELLSAAAWIYLHGRGMCAGKLGICQGPGSVMFKSKL